MAQKAYVMESMAYLTAAMLDAPGFRLLHRDRHGEGTGQQSSYPSHQSAAAWALLDEAPHASHPGMPLGAERQRHRAPLGSWWALCQAATS